MAKDLRSFLKDVQERLPNEYIVVDKPLNPSQYDVTALIKHLDAMKKFPILQFDQPLNLYGKVNPDVKFLMNCEISKGKIQTALGIPFDTDRVRMAEICLEREENAIKPVVVSKAEAPVKEIVKVGKEADLCALPIMRHHEMDGGPYMVMADIVKDAPSGVYNASYHRMEVKGPQLSAFYSSPRHLWKVYREHEARNVPCPCVVVLGHHPAFNMGSCYKGPFLTDEYDIIGGYLQEPLRLVASETWGEDFLVPADAELLVEGELMPNVRLTEGPFGEAPGYLGPQRHSSSLRFEVRAITYRKGALTQSIITPEGDKPWMDLPREAAYLRRVREAVPDTIAVCKGGRHAHYNIFIKMKKVSEGDPGRAAAAALTFDHSKNVFVFDEDIDIYNPTEILWALATRVQPERQVTIIKSLLRGNMLDPSLQHDIKTSGMIIDATRPLDRPFSPVSKCPDDAMARIKVTDFISKELVDAIPLDMETYWC